MSASTLLTRKEAAVRLGITLSTLDLERSCGQLAYIQRKPGGKVLISEAAITDYLARATHPARPAGQMVQTYRKRRV